MSNQDSATSTAVVSDNALSTQDMWEMYVQGIVNATGLPGSNLILTGTTIVANLATTSIAVTPDPTVPEALAQIYSFGDQLLTPTGFYTETGHSFFNDYATYIDNLEPQNAHPTPSQQAAINKAKANLKAANGQYAEDFKAATQAYKDESPNFPGKWPTFQDFLNTTSWGGTLNTDQNAVNGANSQLNTLYTKTYGQNYVAINQNKKVVDQVRTDLTAKKASSPAEMAISTDAGGLVVPTYTPGSLTAFSQWVDTAATGPADGQKPEVSFTIRQGANKYDFSQSAYFSRTSWGEDYFFFSISGTNTEQHSNVDVDTASSTFSVEVSFQAVTTVPINPGPWYDSSLMYAYSNPNGLVLPNALVIGMMPTIKVTFDLASYQSAYSAYASSSSFGVGIFSVAGGGSGSSTSGSTFNSTWDSASLTLTITDISTQPKIIGLQVWEPVATAS